MEAIIALINRYVSGLLKAEADFLEHLDKLDVLEETVCDLSNKAAAEFIGEVLTEADGLIRDSGARKMEFTVQRKRQRTLISSVGDVTFTHTLYKDGDGKTRCLLDEMIHLPGRERFTAPAEAKVLKEAAVHSYQHAADSIESHEQTITKTTVMNKVHAIEEELPELDEMPEERKQCEYLYIEADEDHIHAQKDDKVQGCFFGKLIYLFEGKEEVCNGRRALISPHYFGGLYAGTKANRDLWKEVNDYIEEHYDTEVLKCVYINSDGGAWIRAGAEYIYKGKLVADKYHLMTYINRVARCAEDSEDDIKAEFYKSIYKGRKQKIFQLLDQVQTCCPGSDRAVEECRTYFNSNWEYIYRAFHDEHVLGCSTEGHISNVYSDRMSSRPMGWSETGTDRMCKLRCFIRNYGSKKVLDLVNYRRGKELERSRATGTEGMIEESARIKYTKGQMKAFRYAERMQAGLPENSTVRKILAIREQLWGI